MNLTPQSEAPPPLRRDESGAWRVGDSRVLLELVIRAFQDGATPESIVQRYPAASLADVYGVVAYYLRHQEEVEAYLVERERRAAAVRQRVKQQQPDVAGLRERLLSRREAVAA